MPWVKLDDQFWSNRKVRQAGSAIGTYVRCLSWSAANLTDGEIPADDLDFICSGIADPAADAEILLRAGLLVAAEFGWRIANYLEFNKSREQIEGDRLRDRARKTAGGKAYSASSRNPAGIQPESRRNPDGLRKSHPYPTHPIPSPPITSEPADADTDPPHQPDPIDVDLCSHLADRIETTHGKRPKQPASWHTDMSLLRRRGPTTWAKPEPIEPNRIHKLVDWALDDSFWRDVIRSPAGLRRNYDQLRAAANSQHRQRHAGYELEQERQTTAGLLDEYAADGRSLTDLLAATAPTPIRELSA